MHCLYCYCIILTDNFVDARVYRLIHTHIFLKVLFMDPTNAAAVVMFNSSMKSRNTKSFGSVENLKYVAACFSPKQSFVLSWNKTSDFFGLVYFVSVSESHMLKLILFHSSD